MGNIYAYLHGRVNKKLIKMVTFRERQDEGQGWKQNISIEPWRSESKPNLWVVRKTGGPPRGMTKNALPPDGPSYIELGVINQDGGSVSILR